MYLGTLLILFLPLPNVTTLNKVPFSISYLKHTYTEQANLSTILASLMVMTMIF